MNNRNKTQYNFNAVEEVLPPLLRFLAAIFVCESKIKQNNFNITKVAYFLTFVLTTCSIAFSLFN